jgi:hypothetical protein
MLHERRAAERARRGGVRIKSWDATIFSVSRWEMLALSAGTETRFLLDLPRQSESVDGVVEWIATPATVALRTSVYAAYRLHLVTGRTEWWERAGRDRRVRGP